jgi:hypothetical protein
MPNPDPQTVYLDGKGNRQWRCQHCSRRYAESGGTRVITNHLKSAHHITVHSVRQEQRDRVAGSIEQAMENARQSTGFKRRRVITNLVDESDSEPPKGKYNRFSALIRLLVTEASITNKPLTLGRYILDPHITELLLVRLFTRCNIPLSLVECDEFRALFTYLNQDISSWLPTSANTVKQWVLRTVNDQIQNQIDGITNAKSKIHLWVDAWVSTNHLSVLGVGCSYMGGDGTIKTVLLMLNEIQGAHTGTNLAPMLLRAIEKYKFVHNLGYCIMDNASNNDTMMRELSNRTYNTPLSS